MEKYTRIGEPDEKGFVTAQRLSDNKLARVKRSFFKPSPGGDGIYIAKSKVKALRLDSLDWTEEL